MNGCWISCVWMDPRWKLGTALPRPDRSTRRQSRILMRKELGRWERGNGLKNQQFGLVLTSQYQFKLSENLTTIGT